MDSSSTENKFSIIRGGLLDRILTFLRIITPGDPKNGMRKLIFFVAITWIPLLIFNLLAGSFLGRVDIPFAYDFPVHVRFLLVLPMLLAAERIVDRRVKLIVNQYDTAGLLHPEDKPQFEHIQKITDRMVESAWAEAIILVLIIGNLIFRWVNHEVTVTSWQFPDADAGQNASFAAWWLLTVSIPIFQFIILRWLWRWIIWFRLHLMISKINLNLSPTHPDKACGIGFLGEPPAPFSMVTLSFGIVISSVIASRMIFFDGKLEDYYVLIAVFVFLCIVINIAPFLIYFKPLRKTRIKGIFEYSALVQKHHLEFKDKWFLSTGDKELLIGNADISSMCDFTPVYESIERMTPFPFDLKTMLATVIGSLVPLLPLAALVMPIGDLLKLLVGFVL